VNPAKKQTHLLRVLPPADIGPPAKAAFERKDSLEISKHQQKMGGDGKGVERRNLDRRRNRLRGTEAESSCATNLVGGGGLNPPKGFHSGVSGGGKT